MRQLDEIRDYAWIETIVKKVAKKLSLSLDEHEIVEAMPKPNEEGWVVRIQHVTQFEIPEFTGTQSESVASEEEVTHRIREALEQVGRNKEIILREGIRLYLCKEPGAKWRFQALFMEANIPGSASYWSGSFPEAWKALEFDAPDESVKFINKKLGLK